MLLVFRGLSRHVKVHLHSCKVEKMITRRKLLEPHVNYQDLASSYYSPPDPPRKPQHASAGKQTTCDHLPSSTSLLFELHSRKDFSSLRFLLLLLLHCMHDVATARSHSIDLLDASVWGGACSLERMRSLVPNCPIQDVIRLQNQRPWPRNKSRI